MTLLPEQFLAARQTQLDHGFQLMRSLSDQALDRASRLWTLQIDASRTAVEQSSSTLRQLLAVRDPRELLTLGSQSQEQLRSLFDFGRELFSLAATPYAAPLRTDAVTAPAPGNRAVSEPAPAQGARDATRAAAEAFERIGADTASIAASHIAATVSDTASHAVPPAAAQSRSDFVLPTEAAATPVPEVVTSAIAPDVEPKPIARATGDALEVSLAPPHPVAASVPVEVAVEIELPKIAPVEAAPPPPPATAGPVETRGTKGRRKQT